MKKSLLLCSAWASGYALHASAPYIKALQSSQQEDEQHSFQDYIKQYNYSQPKIIDLLHNSPDKHFLHNMLVQNENAFNVFKVYLPKEVETLNLDEKNNHLHIVFNAAEEVQGNNNDVHSGLLATIIDNAFGQLSFLASGFVPTVTANLQVNYKQPVKTNQDYIITCQVEKVQGRKVYLKATVCDSNNNICSEANALFLTVNWGGKQWKQAIDTLYHNKLFNQGLQKLFFQ